MIENKRRIVVNGQEVVLDGSRLSFSEGTLSEYLETEGGWIDYFGAKLADAERQLAEMEMEIEKEEYEFEKIYSKVFSTLKSTEGGSDKYVEGLTKVDQTVIDAQQKVFNLREKAIDFKHSVRMLHQHLRAWEKNHDNAQNRGNTLRKEMERINKDHIFEEVIKPV
jgi:chromosome segregation ATPase